MMNRLKLTGFMAYLAFSSLFLPIAAFGADHIVDQSDNMACVSWTRGCTPTSAAMVLSYWDRGNVGIEFPGMGRLIDYWREYTEYVDGRSGIIRNAPNVVEELRIAMQTNDDGKTSFLNISPGIKKVCNELNHYDFGSELTTNNLFNDWCWDKIKEEINSNRPFVWSVGQLILEFPFTRGHSLAAWGYTDDKYVITYNTWDCPARDDWYYSQWDNGSDINSSAVNTVVPGGWSWGQTSLIVPDGGEKWELGGIYSIEWFEGDARTWSAELEYSTDGGETWNWIGLVEPSSPGLKTYSWTIPDSVPETEKARVRINNYSGSAGTGWHLEAADGSERNFEIAYDSTPPTPSPMTWEVEPHAISTTEIAMTATTAADKSPPISYSFVREGSYTSGWIPSSSYTFSGLYPNQQYAGSVIAKDSYDNITGRSPSVLAWTFIETPTGMRFYDERATNSSISVGILNGLSNLHYAGSGLWIGCYARSRDNPSGYELVAWSDWMNSLTWEATGLDINHRYYFRARARNVPGVLTPYCDYESRYTLANPLGQCLPRSVSPNSMSVTIDPNGNPSHTEIAIRCTNRNTGETYFLSANGGNNGAEPFWQPIASWGTLTATGLTPGVVYEFSAKARNGDGKETDWSPAGSDSTRGIVIASPNGGETWYVGSANNISWSSYSLEGNVKIEFSQNGGLSWTLVADSTANDGIHPWTVPGPPTNEGLLRITSVLDAAVFDTSNALFSTAERFITVASPNGSEKWPVGAARDIRWTSNGAGPTVKIEISRDNGSTWSMIAGDVENNGSYSWNVEAPASDRCRIRITSVTYPVLADTGDQKFSIIRYAPGALLGWGDNSFGQTDVPAGDSNFVAVSGTYHNLALRMDGSIVGWGDDMYDKVNLPTGEYSAVAAGHMHTIALKADGSLVGTGYNYYGQTDVPTGNDFIAVAAGSDHSMALKADGSIVVWGRNNDGQFDVPIPMPPKGPMIVAIAACGNHNLVLAADGSIAGWGDNLYGQVDVPAGNNFAAIAAGARHSLALKSDGTVVGWGDNNYGQIDVPEGNNFVAIAAGYEHSLALRSDGSVAAWGKNDYGQTDVPAGINFLSISAGARHSLGIAPANTQVGNNTTVQVTEPYAQTVAATLAFNQVNDAGISRLASSPEGEQLPTGFEPGNPPTYYDLKTTADYTGQIGICINYGGVRFGNEAELGLYHYKEGEWVNITSSIDMVNDVICGITTSLSHFVILEPAKYPQVAVKVPVNGSAVQDVVTLAAEASDVSGIAGVYFYIREPDGENGSPIGYDDMPATFNSSTNMWERNFDTTNLLDGYYVILVKAVDVWGNEGWSVAVTFSIRNWAVVELLPMTPKNKAGRTMPIKFSVRIAASVDPAMPFVYNDGFEIRIYEASTPNTILQTSHFGYGITDYRIDSNAQLYITNFKTGKKASTYAVEIWRPSNNFIVGSFTFQTVK